MTTRRRLLQQTVAAAAAGVWSRAGWSLGNGHPLRLLILGGTGFLGPHLVRAALVRGHKMTLFNRGKTNPGLFSELEQLRGDRDGGLSVLSGRQWDAVIDTSGYVPRLVSDSATLLADSVGRYVFISTLSVYASFAALNMDESAPVGVLEDPSIEKVTGESYGPLKALCEQAAKLRAGLDAEREREVLAAWKRRDSEDNDKTDGKS